MAEVYQRPQMELYMTAYSGYMETYLNWNLIIKNIYQFVTTYEINSRFKNLYFKFTCIN